MISIKLTKDLVSITQPPLLCSLLLTLPLSRQSTSIQTNATSTEKSMEPVENHQMARKVISI